MYKETTPVRPGEVSKEIKCYTACFKCTDDMQTPDPPIKSNLTLKTLSEHLSDWLQKQQHCILYSIIIQL